MHVLFVCTGNICRSPTAERLAAIHASRRGVDGFTFSSAGVRAMRGYPIHREAASVLEQFGASPEGFTARQFSTKIASDCDLIVTMTRQHRDEVLAVAPRQLRRTFTLAEVERLVTKHDARSVAQLVDLRPLLAGADLADVPDSIGREAGVFRSVGQQIFDLIPAIVEVDQ